MNKILGPVLIIIGMFLLELLQINTKGSGISEKMQNPDLTTPQRMMLGIALEECVATLKRHEKILQWMML